MHGLFFQTFIITEATGAVGPSAVPQIESTSVRLSARAPLALQGEPIAASVNAQLSVLAARIRATMPVIGGVLIGISFDQANVASESGYYSQSLVSLDILGVGRVPKLVLGMHEGRFASRKAQPGWTPRTVYLWVTV